MVDKIEELNKKFKELVQKPIKSKGEIELQQEISVAIEKALNDETKSLLNELNAVGVNVTSLWELVNTKSKYSNAIPVLIEHLTKNYSEKSKEGIIRALAVKEATGKASAVLLDEYNKIPKDKMLFRWAIGNTVYITITEDDVDRILPIILDKENGNSRQMFIAALGKLSSVKAEDVLIKLLDDDEVAAQALDALGRMKSKKAREKILTLTSHPNALIKKEAQKTLKKLS